MDYMTFFNKVLDIKPGSFIRIKYKTTVPVKSEYKKKGYSIEKIVSDTVRVGIDYHKIGPIVELESSNTSKVSGHKSNIHWTIKKYFLINEETEDKYLAIYPLVKNSNKFETFYITTPYDKIVTDNVDEVKEFVINSYWDKKFSYQKSIKVDNVIQIGKYVVK